MIYRYHMIVIREWIYFHMNLSNQNYVIILLTFQLSVVIVGSI